MEKALTRVAFGGIKNRDEHVAQVLQVKDIETSHDRVHPLVASNR